MCKLCDQKPIAKCAIRVPKKRKEKKMEKISLLKDKKITEDENKNFEKSTQKLTDDHISKIDKITEEKEKEVSQL